MDQATQAYYMKHLGIPMWIPRDFDAEVSVEQTHVQGVGEAVVSAELAPQPNPEPAQPAVTPSQKPSDTAAVDDSDAEFIDPSQLQALARKATQKTRPDNTVQLAQGNANPADASNLDGLLNATWEGLRSAFAQLAADSSPNAVAARGSIRAKTAVFNADAIAHDPQEIQRYNALLASMLKAMQCNPAACFYGEAMRYQLGEEATKKQRAVTLRQAALLDVDTVVVIGEYALAENVLAVLGNAKVLRLPSPAAILSGALTKQQAWQQMAPQLRPKP